VLRRRNAGLALRILPAPVQGEGAAQAIARQIRVANEFEMGDVIIVTRGGGSLEDLLPFYEESVVRAIAESRIPVVSAVGHEIDVTLSDLAADVRAPTPSAAAEMVSASRIELAARLRSLESAVAEAFRNRFERARLLVSQFSRENLERNLRLLLQPLLLRVDAAREALQQGVEDRIVPARHRLQLLEQSLRDSSPLAILERGYAVVTHEASGAVLTSTEGVELEDMLGIRLHRGGLRAAVKERNA
jgi:exodeoxyribonuclease VII large subunit